MYLHYTLVLANSDTLFSGISATCSRLIGLKTELLHLNRRDPMTGLFAFICRPVHIEKQNRASCEGRRVRLRGSLLAAFHSRRVINQRYCLLFSDFFPLISQRIPSEYTVIEGHRVSSFGSRSIVKNTSCENCCPKNYLARTSKLQLAELATFFFSSSFHVGSQMK